MADAHDLTRLFARPIALGTALLLAGPLSASTGLLPPLAGFGMFVGGGLMACVSGVLGGLLVWRKGGRFVPLVGGGLAALACLLGPALAVGDAPTINDISTDLEDVPPIDDGRTDGGLGLDMSYDRSFAAVTREAYPDVVGPVAVDVPFEFTPDLAQGCLAALGGLRITSAVRSQEPGVGEVLVQATFVTRIFRFRDDVVVRVRGQGSKSTLDVRSKSRDGKGDMGANAARVRAIRDCLQTKAAGG